MVAAVAEMHMRGCIHRDIKPENVLFASSVDQSVQSGAPLVLKLIDLGLATRCAAELPLNPTHPWASWIFADLRCNRMSERACTAARSRCSSSTT